MRPPRYHVPVPPLTALAPTSRPYLQRAGIPVSRPRRAREFFDSHSATDHAVAVSLREFLQAQDDAMEERCLMRYTDLHQMVDRRFHGLQVAGDKAEMALDKRLEGMNDIRTQLATQRATFATNERLDAVIDASRLQITATISEKITNGQVVRQTIERDIDALNTRLDTQAKEQEAAISILQQQYAGLDGRIAGMLGVGILVAIGVQVILFFVVH